MCEIPKELTATLDLKSPCHLLIDCSYCSPFHNCAISIFRFMWNLSMVWRKGTSWFRKPKIQMTDSELLDLGSSSRKKYCSTMQLMFIQLYLHKETLANGVHWSQERVLGGECTDFLWEYSSWLRHRHYHVSVAPAELHWVYKHT